MSRYVTVFTAASATQELHVALYARGREHSRAYGDVAIALHAAPGAHNDGAGAVQRGDDLPAACVAGHNKPTHSPRRTEHCARAGRDMPEILARGGRDVAVWGAHERHPPGHSE